MEYHNKYIKLNTNFIKTKNNANRNNKKDNV